MKKENVIYILAVWVLDTNVYIHASNLKTFLSKSYKKTDFGTVKNSIDFVSLALNRYIENIGDCEYVASSNKVDFRLGFNNAVKFSCTLEQFFENINKS